MENGGTYNYIAPPDTKNSGRAEQAARGLGHGIVDYFPYVAWGNTPPWIGPRNLSEQEFVDRVLRLYQLSVPAETWKQPHEVEPAPDFNLGKYYE